MPRVMKFALMLFILTACASDSHRATEPTSEIPQRREFPVSKNINACNDFFQYACAGAIAKFKLREDRSRHIFAFGDPSDRILESKKKYLSELLLKTPSNDRERQLKSFYGSCMDEGARKVEEREVLKSVINELKDINSKKEFAKFMTAKSLDGESGHMGFGNIPNLDNSDIYDFIILPRRMTSMPERSYYKNEKLMAEFRQLATAFYQTAGYDQAAQRADWLIKFEDEFVNNYPTPTEKRKLWSQRSYVTKAALRRDTTRLELGKVLAKVPKGIKIRYPMKSTTKFLNKAIGRYSLEQLKSIYLFQEMSSKLDLAYPEYFKMRFAFSNKHLGGPPKRPDIKERCTKRVMWRFAKEIDVELFDEIFPNFPEEKFVSLLEKVRGSILEGLKKNDWLSKKARKNAIKKIKLAKFQVVAPKNDKEWYFNPSANYDSKRYLNNVKVLDKKLIEREWSEINQPVDKSRWYYGPLKVNAYYSPTENKFVMPAGILQYPFYDPKLPEWVNLGAVGAVVGHELGHGIDDQGSKYDEKGKVRRWMTDTDIKNFKSRGQKLVQQFSAAGNNGELTLGENIGDLVGVTFALNAAQKIFPTEKSQRDRATKDFFLQYARAWCGVLRPKRRELQFKTDPHAFIEARVNEQMKHQAEFARVFQCKPGDRLVLSAEERVKIW